MRFCFCQVSNSLINPENGSTAEKFYNTFWDEKHKDGFYRPEHFFELPVWIAEIVYTLPEDVEPMLHIVTDEQAELPDADYYLFSVLDVNRQIVQQIIYDNPQKQFNIGGYIEFDKYFLDYTNVACFASVRDFAVYHDFDYRYGTDYSLFAGMECVPRLTLSTGCRHRCKFCIVPNEVVEKTATNVWAQVYSFIEAKLKFKLVYLNDKTFGQADNHRDLEMYYKVIKYNNPEFEGFIVQTTAAKVGELPKTVWQDCHIKIVEIGVETYNDSLLQQYRKPAREVDIDGAVTTLAGLGVKVIANIILGLPGETSQTYAKTYDFLSDWMHCNNFYSLNIYTFAAYADAEATKELNVNAGDTDELNDNRTFWTDEERRAFNVWSESFYKLGIDIILEDENVKV